MQMNAGSMIRCAGLAALATPLAIALIARVGLGGPPPAAHAGPQSQITNQPAATPLPSLTSDQEQVLVYARQALAQPFAASPMHRIDSTTPEAPDSVVSSAPETPPVIIPKFDVTAVVISSRQSLATINGELRRIGDEVAPGWRLATIDARQGVMLIVGDDGQRVEISIRQMVR